MKVLLCINGGADKEVIYIYIYNCIIVERARREER